MVNYICDRCGFESTIKTRIQRHLERKYICKPKLKDIDISIIYNKYFNNDKKVGGTKGGTKSNLGGTKSGKCGTKCGTRWYKNEKNNINDEKKIINQEIIKDMSNTCKYCHKEFTDRHGRWKHEKYRCKMKDVKMTLVQVKNDITDITNKDDLIKYVSNMLTHQFEKELSQKNEQIAELIKKSGVSVSINNSNNNNNANNTSATNLLTTNNSLLANNITNAEPQLKLNAYNRTDYSHIRDEDYLECIQKGNLGIPHFIKMLHFNKDKPENHNVFINNLKSNYLHQYDGGRWIQKVQYEEVDMMIQDIVNIIEDKIEFWYDTDHKFIKDHKVILDKFPRFLERLSDSSYVSTRVERESKLQLFNDKHMVLEYKDRMERRKKIL